MSKHFLFIVDPLDSLSVKTDTTLALIEETCTRGISAFACEIKDIFLRAGKVHFLAAPITLEPGYTASPRYMRAPMSMSADEFEVIFMRKDPPVDDAFLAALLMLRCHDRTKTKVINDPDGVLLANEKLFGLTVASAFFPPTLVSRDRGVMEEFISYHERVVLKPLFQAGGAGVLVFDRDDRNLASALSLLSQSFSAPVMVQSYIKEARLGDKRIIVLGGEPIGAIMRMPNDSDHRANFHAGGSPKATTVTDYDREIVSHLRPHLVACGLHLVGIDVIGTYLTEINVTSPTCVIEIERLSQAPSERPLRAQIIDYVDTLIALA